MLTHLSIRNVVLIDQCEIDFAPGLCVLTGETGAGKSILLDALGLVLGARTDAGLVRHGETNAQVTAEFDIAENEAACAVLKELELEEAPALVIRRTISAEGKSRCLVNDQSVSLNALKRLGETLVEIQGQHDSRGLMDASSHRTLLDEYGRLDKERQAVKRAHVQWKTAGGQLFELLAEIERTKREEDYLRHVVGELKKLNPQEGEEESLSAERTGMMQNEKLFSLLNEATGEIGGANPASMRLRSAQRLLMRSGLNAEGRFNAAIDLLDKAAEAADLAHESLEAIGQAAEFNPSRLESVEERLFALKAAARKYGIGAEQLSAFRAESEAKLALLDAQEHRLEGAKAQEAEARAMFVARAEELGKARRQTAKKLEKAIAAELEPLKMGGTHFRVGFDPLPESQWNEAGIESITFEVATNAGKKAEGAVFSSLSKIASGGELSRFLLAMKVSLSSVRSTSTLIFDEIDTGTGGAVAAAIGERLERLARSVQVMVVTHLPQVAAKGAEHLQVSKREVKGKITTQVRPLSPEERREELARMLSGSEITREARSAAKKLLEPVA